jgi:hypothetical protein
MKLRPMLAVVATAAALPLGAAWATQPTGPQGTFLWNEPGYPYPAFSAMDRNRDGIISRDEYALATGTVPAPAPVVVAPAPVIAAPVVPAPVPPAAVVYQPAPVAYAPVVVAQPAPMLSYSWHSADSNPPAPAP